jgi:hypothetical protein
MGKEESQADITLAIRGYPRRGKITDSYNRVPKVCSRGKFGPLTPLFNPDSKRYDTTQR